MVPHPPPATAGTVARTDPDAEQLFVEIMLDPLNEDPYLGYRRLREQAPALLTGDGTLVLTRFEDCDTALRHRALGKSDKVLDLGLALPPVELRGSVPDLLRRSMLFANPPDHTRLRRLVSTAFTARHVEALRPAVTARTEALLEALAAEPSADFMDDLALPLPVNVISDLLGVPEADRLAFTPKVHAMVSALEPTADLDCLTLGQAAGGELFDYFSALLTDKRSRPADDLLSRLVASHEDDALDEQEMISTALLLFIAGFETTTNLLGNGMLALLRQPAQLDRLRDHPELIPTAVEELLRYDSPVQFGARAVLEPTTLAGTDLQPGQLVLTVLAAANHDPDRFEDPDQLNIGRSDSGHLAFASGIHFCLGAHLTRLEAHVFLQLLARGFDIAPAGEPTRRQGFTLRGLDHLPITLTPRPEDSA